MLDYKPEIKFPNSLDSTMISAFDACPTKFLYEFILKKSPVGISVHLHAGGCIASATEDVRNAFYRDGLSLNDCYDYAFPRFVQNWGNYTPPEKEYKDFTNCWMAVEHYFKEYPPETDYFQPLMQADGSPCVEFKFAIPLGIMNPDTGDPILYSGRLDMLSQPKDGQDGVFGVDEKTTKALGPSWQYQWDMRGQFYGYYKACQEYGYDVRGMLVRGIAIQQTQFGFQEKPIFYDDRQIAVWYEQLHRKVFRLVDMYNAAKEAYLDGREHIENIHHPFDMSFGEACGSYGGCQYKDLCLHPEPWMLYQSYETREWDPLKKNPTEDSEDRLSQMDTISLQDALGGEWY